jgi:glycosyltransferase involved in cell wall biosynthesis
VSTLAGLSVVLPCFNEEASVERAVLSAADAAAGTSDDYEVIVVDDGSADATLAIASELARRDRRVRVLVHAGARGHGAAVRTGMDAARMPWVLLIDAGLPVDPHELEGCVPIAAHADLVVGWRVAGHDRLTRRIGATARNLVVRRVFGAPVHDVDCAFKLVRRDLVARLPLTAHGPMIGAQLVVRALAAGGRVREVAVDRQPRSARPPSHSLPRRPARRRLSAR